MFLTVLGFLLLALAIVAGVTVAMGNREVRALPEVAVDEGASWPKLSVVIAARNEARDVEAAVRSMLAIDYPNLEIVAVDDRSEDATGTILDGLARENPILKTLRIRELPDGWLGKNHALHQGAMASKGEWILFTDADVHFHAGAVKKAVAYALSESKDHLAVIPDVVVSGQILPMMISYFTLCFALNFQPWKVRDPKSAKFVGIGAFNLVRRSAYQNVGGHTRIALRPDDDLRLGQLLKRAGARSDLLLSQGWVRVEWYRSFPEMFRGLEKNVFAGADYSVAKMAAMTVVTLLIHVFPFVFLLVCKSMFLWALYAGVATAWFLAALDNNRFHRMPSWTAFVLPFSALLMLATMLHSAGKTLWLGGIRWRGTFYPLRALRSNPIS